MKRAVSRSKAIADYSKRVIEIGLRRKDLLRIADTKGTPCFVYDAQQAKENFGDFTGSFWEAGLDARVYYAVKSNPYLGLLRDLVRFGAGLDVSSPAELALAAAAGAKRVIYTGPAKSASDFEKILAYRHPVTVHLESRKELDLLGRLCAKKKSKVGFGVRVFTPAQGDWSKFGIPLRELADFLNAAQQHEYVEFAGVQFHNSFNFGPERYAKNLRHLVSYARSALTSDQRSAISFIDIGGGFFPRSFEAIYDWNSEQAEKELDYKKILSRSGRYLPLQHKAFSHFAEGIAGVWKREIQPLFPRAVMYCEPGRALSHSVMHMLLRVADVRGKHSIIVDGGMNMIGWEKYQYYLHAPIFNLTRFAPKKEQRCLVYGSLCTPEDVWGYSVLGGEPRIGDVLVMPYQGAYTYTCAQRFIRDIPPVFGLP